MERDEKPHFKIHYTHNFRNRETAIRLAVTQTNNSDQFKTAFQLIRIYTQFDGRPRIILYTYDNIITRYFKILSSQSLQSYVSLRGEMPCRVVSPSFHSVYIHVSPFYFRIGLQMQKGERLLGEREFTLVGCSNTSATVPSQPIVSSILMRNIYPAFALSSGRSRSKARRYFLTCLTFHHFFFFFLIITFFHVSHSKSYLRGIVWDKRI